MKIFVSKHIGYCPGVKKAVALAYGAAGQDCACLGHVIHNADVVAELEAKGMSTVQSVDDIKTSSVLIRSHGIGDDVYDKLRAKGVKIIDGTCPFVMKIHDLVRAHYRDGYHIVVIGKASHAEVVGINGCCEYTATIVESEADCKRIPNAEKLCVVVQTTFLRQEYEKIVKIVSKHDCKTLEIFNTICYTTLERQKEVAFLASKCNKMLILGGSDSSNTNQLFQISLQQCRDTYLVSDIKQMSSIFFDNKDCVGITSGASTRDELIQEVLQVMSENNEVQKENFEELFEKQVNESVVIRVGSVIENAIVLEANDEGIWINLGTKNDGFVSKEDAVLEGEYNPADFQKDAKISVIITGTRNNDTGLIPASKKKLDAINKGNEIVNTIRNGEEFALKITEAVDKGLISKLGNYRVFIPQSQVEEHFVKNLKPYVGRSLRLRALEIDDNKHKIVASQKVILQEERVAKENEFFDNIFVDAVVIGKVMRATKFGAFVNVGGFDCLAHIVDLSWGKINKVEDVLTIGQEYEFVVLKIDRDKKRVSLGYKQLHLHPFAEFISKHGVGDVVEGTVVRLKEFGAFVKLAENVDGLVHISEASHSFVKNITEVLKVGDEVKVMITKIDEENRKISLSIKAATEPPILAETEEVVEEKPAKKARGERKPRAEKNPDEQKTWNEDTANNPFADLLKGIKTED